MASKTIIVTGAGRGIGLAASKYLLERAHKVILVARTESELKALKDQYPSQVEYLAADLADLDVSPDANARTKEELMILKLMTECCESHRPCCEVWRQDRRSGHQPRRA